MNEVKQPEMIGPYRIEGKLGQGGMGAVFRGVHETLERPAAVKLLPGEFAQHPEYVARFLREARVIAGLRHDHIVGVYDAGAYEGRYFIAMELIEGQSLAAVLDQYGPLDVAYAITLMEQAARGLSAAHVKGCVHRDIKPENLLIDKEGKLRIVDFGLVMESTSNTHLTAAGAHMGTPMYMSPEQTDGLPADGRTDLYSLGVTFYRALTAQVPFNSSSVMNLMFKHKFEAPPDPRQYRPDLPENLSNLILRMIAKKPEDRPQSADELLTVLQGVRGGMPVSAPPPVPPLQSGAHLLLTPEPTSPPAPGMPNPAVISHPNLPGGATVPPPVVPAPKRSIAGFMVLGGICGLVLLGVVLYFAFSKKDPNSNAQSGDGGSNANANPSGAQTREDLLKDAQRAEAQGDRAKAIEALKKAAALGNPDELRERIGRLLWDEAKNLAIFGDPRAAQVRAEAQTYMPDPAVRLPATPVTPNGVKSQADADAARAKAVQLVADNDFLSASEQYRKAAQLTPDPVQRLDYLGQGSACELRHWLALGQRNEQNRTWDEAFRAYSKALEFKDDPNLAGDFKAQARGAQEAGAFCSLMDAALKTLADARRQLEAQDARLANASIDLALKALNNAKRTRPNSPALQEYSQDGLAYQAIAAGDDLRGQQNLAAAREKYELATTLSQTAAPLARSRLDALPKGGGMDPTAGTIKEADRLVTAGQTADALKTVDLALAARPGNATLTTLKSALASLAEVERIAAGSLNTLNKVSNQTQGLRDNDERDEARKLQDATEARGTEAQRCIKEARTVFLSHKYNSLNDTLLAVRSNARALADDLDHSRGRTEREATDAERGMGIGPLRTKGDKARAQRLRDIAREIGKLSEEARALVP